MIAQRMAQQGAALFQYRGILPFVVVVPAAWSLHDFNYLFHSHQWQDTWDWGCLLVTICGLAIRVTTVGFVPIGTSGRNTRVQRAPTLNTTGWYSVSRNPLYLGNYIVCLGFMLTLFDPLLVGVYTLAFWLYYERIIAAEEAFLEERFSDHFRNWAAQTAAFLPDLSGWKPPSKPFCWRTVLRREYCTVMLIGSVFFAIDALQHLFVDRRFDVDANWTAVFLCCLAIFTVLRTVKKRTRLLHVEGR